MKKTRGFTITYWLNGSRRREYHADAVRLGCRIYEGEQFDVLFDKEHRVIASVRAGQLLSVEQHTKVNE